MTNYTKKKINKGLIVLNKGERTAVITLLSLIALLLGFSLFRPAIPLSRAERRSTHNLDSLLAVYASRKESTDPPTTASRPKDPPVRHETVRDSQPKKNVTSTQPTRTETYPASAPVTKKTPKSLLLNTADSTELIALPQIGEVMASRIHRYRDRLGGYVTLDQLFEVKGMDTARFETIQPYLILETSTIRHLNINQDEFKTLLRHPYLEYEQVKAIVNYRERKGLIRNWQQLKEITGDVNPLLEQYLTY